MYIFSIDPKGVLTSINLGNMLVWRLELTALGNNLGIGIRYLMGQRTSVSMIAALDCLSAKDELISIAKTGLPKGTIPGDKERLAESMKILFNADLKEAQVSELIQKGSGLVDIYHQVLTSLRSGLTASGKFESWRWAVSPGDIGWEITSLGE